MFLTSILPPFSILDKSLSPWLSGWRSASRVRTQVWRCPPGRCLQSLGRPRIDVCRALNVSSEKNGAILFGWVAAADVYYMW